MKLYLCDLPGERRYMEAAEIWEGRKWGLPGLVCDACGETWSATGYVYPTVDLSGFPDQKALQDLWPIPIVEHLRLRERLAEYVPSKCVLLPGTDFGPATGKLVGPSKGFVWTGGWCLFLGPKNHELLLGEGLALPPVGPSEAHRRGKPVDLLEFEIDPSIDILDECLIRNCPPCARCGRRGASWNHRLVVDRRAIPEDCELMRVRNKTTLILCTDRFAEAVKRLKIPGMEFREVEIR